MEKADEGNAFIGLLKILRGVAEERDELRRELDFTEGLNEHDREAKESLLKEVAEKDRMICRLQSELDCSHAKNTQFEKDLNVVSFELKGANSDLMDMDELLAERRVELENLEKQIASDELIIQRHEAEKKQLVQRHLQELNTVQKQRNEAQTDASSMARYLDTLLKVARDKGTYITLIDEQRILDLIYKYDIPF